MHIEKLIIEQPRVLLLVENVPQSFIFPLLNIPRSFLLFVPLWTMTAHPGGPDAASVLWEGGGDAQAEPARSGSEAGGSAAESR